jgi:hypothetical protein
MTATAVGDAASQARMGECLPPTGPTGFVRLRAGTSVAPMFVRDVSGGAMAAVPGRCKRKRALRGRPSTSRTSALAPV